MFYLPADQFFRAAVPDALTYDDVSLATEYSEILPRMTDLRTQISEGISLRVPILSADMDTVTESRMAIAMSLNGGMGLIHYNMPPDQQVREVSEVKRHIHGLIRNPATVAPNLYIGDILELVEEFKYSFSTFPVADEAGRLIGLLPGKVVRERYRGRRVTELMTPRGELLTIHEKELGSDPITTADRVFTDHPGTHKILVVNDEDRLSGLFTLTDVEEIISEASRERRASRDSSFRLLAGAAISPAVKKDGTLNKDAVVNHVARLSEAAVDAIAVSSAHAFTAIMGQMVRFLREHFPHLTIIAGNVTTGAGVEYLADCGADAIKVGQGPGSICTTRIVAGVGIPQLTAVYVASRAARNKGVRIIADGGINKSGDIVKALTMADAVICGGMLAGCREAPGEIIEIEGKIYKQYRGMGSLAAMKKGSATRYGHEHSSGEATKEAPGARKVAAEGIEALKEVSGSVDQVLGQLAGGIQAGLGYLGAGNLAQLRDRARFVRLTGAGMAESRPHDVIEISKRSA
jgi:IMP dehydrogenase